MLPFFKNRPPSPPNLWPPSPINISSPVGHTLANSERYTTARERCLTARDRAQDEEMRLYWLHCAKHFEFQMGVRDGLGAFDSASAG